ncbi:hypothetical protein [Brockia lithotrophica]|uniref:Uncharacterized protein n=1 Tax=Brockia lithotrophica TaxID=933949 RepID=A0A660KSV6_9BACL|nr:hypothetical protein [Brockia lithotrophica]RKQ83509.1 hypothetical protein C7438_1762 [Brockia lithotrophica]
MAERDLGAEMDELRGQLELLRQDVQALTGTLKGLGQAQAERADEEIRSFLRSLGERFSEEFRRRRESLASWWQERGKTLTGEGGEGEGEGRAVRTYLYALGGFLAVFLLGCIFGKMWKRGN